MKTFKDRFIALVSYFFILLFCYAAISKIIDFENFQVQIGQSPVLSAYAGTVSYSVVIIEISIVVILSIYKTRWIGLYASTALMSAFTIYIYLILNYSDSVPCSCGGILESLGWTEHLIFNLSCVVFGIAAVYLSPMNTSLPKVSITMILLVSNILSCGLVVLLFINSEKIIKQDNNFTRRFLMHPIIENRTKLLDNPYYYFAGADNDAIYLGNRKFPQKISEIDSGMNEIKRITIALDITELPYKKIETKVAKPFYYIYDGTVPIIKKGLLSSSKPKTVSQNMAYFSQLEIINTNHYVLRTQSSRSKQLVIASLQSDNIKNKIKLYPNIIEKQSDGVFDSDGTLNVDRSNADIIYTYLYRNQFIVADSGFIVQNRLNTIDTVMTAHIKSVALPGGIYKMEKPPLKVNGFSTVHRKLLFNQSYLKGRYESEKRWKKSKVIDVYKTDSKLYIGSLYLENRKENSVTDIIVTDQFLYGIAGSRLTQYKLTQPLLKYFKQGEAENLNKE